MFHMYGVHGLSLGQTSVVAGFEPVQSASSAIAPAWLKQLTVRVIKPPLPHETVHPPHAPCFQV
jgi:hypothetical protein